MSDPQDVKRRVYPQLLMLAQNPPHLPNEDDVAGYQKLLDQLAGLGYDLDDFRIDPEREMFRRLATVSPRGSTYYEMREVKPGVFPNKVNALLLYFDLDEKQTQIGFNAPRTR